MSNERLAVKAHAVLVDATRNSAYRQLGRMIIDLTYLRDFGRGDPRLWGYETWREFDAAAKTMKPADPKNYAPGT